MTAPAQPTLPEKLEHDPEYPTELFIGGIGIGEISDVYEVSGLPDGALAAEIAKRYNAHRALVTFVERWEHLSHDETIDSANLWRVVSTMNAEARVLLATVRGRP